MAEKNRNTASAGTVLFEDITDAHSSIQFQNYKPYGFVSNERFPSTQYKRQSFEAQDCSSIPKRETSMKKAQCSKDISTEEPHVKVKLSPLGFDRKYFDYSLSPKERPSE